MWQHTLLRPVELVTAAFSSRENIKKKGPRPFVSGRNSAKKLNKDVRIVETLLSNLNLKASAHSTSGWEGLAKVYFRYQTETNNSNYNIVFK